MNSYRGQGRRHSDRRDELWTVGDHQDFEAGIADQLAEVNRQLQTLDTRVDQLGNRLATVLGGLGVLVVVANIAAALVIPQLVK